MGIYYYKLFDLMNKRNVKKGQLLEMAGFSNTTMAKLSSHKNVEVAVIDKICHALSCQPGDIMEYIPTTSPFADDSNDESPIIDLNSSK